MIGTTRSRVSFFMNKFRKLGFIEYNGKIEVHNSLLNVILYDKPEINTRDTGRCHLGACPSNSGFCWSEKRESDSLPPHEQDIPRLEDR
jgi:hypothetical protein